MSQSTKQNRKGDDGGRKAGRGGGGGKKLRGLANDSPEVRISKTLSWILRHGAKSEGLYMRPDGCVRVSDLLSTPKLHTQLDIDGLQDIVKNDKKMRFTMLSGPDEASSSAGDILWIRANQGHSIKAVKLELKPLTDPSEVPMAVHGTNREAWKKISEQGLSKMTRNHIHLAQGVPESGVISGMRNTATVLIYIDLRKAMNDGLQFYVSDNGVILTEGDAEGFIRPQFFSRVEDKQGRPIPGWQPPQASEVAQKADVIGDSDAGRAETVES